MNEKNDVAAGTVTKTFTLPLAKALAMASVASIDVDFGDSEGEAELVTGWNTTRSIQNHKDGFEKGSVFVPVTIVHSENHALAFAHDAQVTIDENGCADAVNNGGLNVRFEFLMTRPFTAKDAGLAMPDAEALTHDPVTGIIGAASDADAAPSSPDGLMRVWMFGG